MITVQFGALLPHCGTLDDLLVVPGTKVLVEELGILMLLFLQFHLRNFVCIRVRLGGTRGIGRSVFGGTGALQHLLCLGGFPNSYYLHVS